MGLIKEPKHIDFYVEDRQLTEEEQRLLQEAIDKNKASNSKRGKVLRPRVNSKARTKPKVSR